MYVKYYGHACFSVCDGEKSVLIDPFGDIGYKQEPVQADFCLCTHSHYDHHSTDCVTCLKVIDENSVVSEDWLSVIDSYHDEVMGKKRGKNSIYKLMCEGFSLCHMGDLGMPFNDELVAKIGKVDLLFIPVGGTYTIDAREALKYLLAIKPKIVIPMHYKTNRSDIDISSKDEFLSFFDSVKSVPSQFELTKNDFSAQKTIILDLDDSNF